MLSLTRRSALVPVLALSGLWAAASLVACAAAVTDSRPDTTHHDAPPVVTVSPTTVQVDVGKGAQLTATVKNGDGTPVQNPSITWSTSSASIATVSSSGYVNGVAAGHALIIASSAGVADTVAATVQTPAAVPVASVVLSPDTATIAIGGTRQMSVVLRDAGGNTLAGRAVAYASTASGVASVSASGLVSGVAAGTARVIATSEGKADTSTITVPASPPPTTKLDTLFREDFESGSFAAWTDGYDSSIHHIVTSVVHGGTHALEMTANAGSDGAGWLTHFMMPGYDSMYVSAWLRYGSNSTTGSKLLALRGSRIDNKWSAFGQAGVCPNGTDFFSAAMVTDGSRGAAPGVVRFYSYYVGMAKSGTQCWGSYGEGKGAVYAEDGSTTNSLSPAAQWHHVEIFLRLNTPGQSNSAEVVWIDGKKIGEWNGLVYRTTTDLRLNSLQLDLSIVPGPSTTERFYWDDILILNGRPGGTN